MADIDEAALAEAYNRGLAAEKAGDLDAAEAAYREVLAIDPYDRGGASIRLAAMGRAAAPATAPPAYVATLFDQNAAAFDDMLVEQLGYAVPMLVRERIAALGLGPWERMLDLGCGTGLTGASMTDLASSITGVDLSEAMLDEAHERGCYDALYIAEAVGFLTATTFGDGEDDEPEPWDLVTATDVLPYIGALEPFFAGLDRCLAPGGTLVVSTEAAGGDAADWSMGARHRYAHAPGYIARLLDAHGCEALEMRSITVRADEGTGVPGQLVIARRR